MEKQKPGQSENGEIILEEDILIFFKDDNDQMATTRAASYSVKGDFIEFFTLKNKFLIPVSRIIKIKSRV